ncbi:hypothetical protein [Streptomyces sparsogenes]|uniref:Uncharacterized protein n=1 Tax=Streptomyces sparsogenes DSM 40356 TaxID=1331668 RepID=A0A1R1S7W5_9ACTN|nr:hypothetical protein [Streptomyces sparsogenes]OMI34416.1 hypothetical protein SPAR_36571 [Streptomyces sparsogenes DSM 40356]
MAAGTLADQRKATEAAATIARVFGHLPPATFQVSSITPGQLDISLHDSLADFEAWRVALGMLPEWVDKRTQPSAMSLTARGRFAGVEVALIGYAPLLKAVA